MTKKSNPSKPPEVLPPTDIEQGLSTQEAARRLEQYGPNALAEKKLRPLERFLGYFWGPIPWMIETAAILSMLLGDWADFAIIVTMLLVNAGVDFWQESRAGSAIEALKENLALSARTLRDGRWTTLPAADLVPGDIVALRIGNVVPADIADAQGSLSERR
ncbi:hypothetical protein GCM10007972_26190 [Iodidimonas muriae]|uniref:Cation-transporting P-type ATPase N-terminal domain-containing protein n=1 Tax=Iodidimonas muriae TaxID=261467 RepID=A0ABQ2LGT4_9PROT|nr:cation-transporting P-type ATPase [Iodidimonas muriae]GER08478.1 hypothetical protein JCM17843_27880 [Kordiimonadales bacterium JCM 17843]GGO16764.1 hypothetical protein GCM10007972_26190 [Iodidimonas muriae]